MSQSRIEIFEQMLVGDPANTMIMFGLAKEYEKAGDDPKMIDTLERYLAAADDEGNAYGMLARAYERAQQAEKARETYQRGWKSRRRMAIPAWQKNTDRF
jgi:predicted Zn-dependent protease